MGDGSIPKTLESISAGLPMHLAWMRPEDSSKHQESLESSMSLNCLEEWPVLNKSGRWNLDGRELLTWLTQKLRGSSHALSPNLNLKRFVKVKLPDSAAESLDIPSLGSCGF